MNRLTIAVGLTAGLFVAAPSLAQAHDYHRHHVHHSAYRHDRPHYAGAWASDTGAVYGGTELITNGPVPDTPGNRARFGGPMSHGGRMTAPVGD